MEKREARKWMRLHVSEYVEAGGEVNCTRLAEECAAAFDANDEGGPLDDELHWIWELAFEEGERHEKGEDVRPHAIARSRREE